MKKQIYGRILGPAAGLLCLLALQSSAQILVIDDGLSFTPDPVSIVTGEAIEWQDDGTGPYLIISDTGAWPTFQTPGGVLFDQPGTYAYHDDVGDTGTIFVSANVPPTVVITNPAMNAVFTAPATFLFGADASDSDADGLSDVEFYVGTNLVDDIFSSPFVTTVTNLPAGTYLLTAIAYDNAGASATNSITIFVQNSIPITLTHPRLVAGKFAFDASGLTAGKTNIVEISTNLISTANWLPFSTNVATASTMSFTNSARGRGFFRLIQLP